MIGLAAEDAAVRFLTARGLRILSRNYRRRLGELDVIAREAETLVIIEVRSRTRAEYGGAAASVSFRKQQRIVRAASQLLQRRRELARLPARFDVIVVHEPLSAQPRIEWIQHAFRA